MTIPSGAASLSDVNAELGNSPSATITLNDANVRALAAKYNTNFGYFSPGTSIDIANLRGITFGFQGLNYGYTSGGYGPPFNPTSAAYRSRIDRYPYATAANATNLGNLWYVAANAAGHSSLQNGYTSGGFYAYVTYSPSYFYWRNYIQKWPFSATITYSEAQDIGDITVARNFVAGHSSKTYAYSSGGYSSPYPPGTQYTRWNVIDRFPFASDTNASDVGDLALARQQAAGQSGPAYGYTSGGETSPGVARNEIDRFPFASNSNATDVGDLTVSRRYVTGQSSSSYGYTSGGYTTGPTNVIDRFPIAAGSNATDVGDLGVSRYGATGSSSTSYGYSAGGYSTGYTNYIDRFPIASGGSAVDSGMDLSQNIYSSAGHQI